MKNLTQCSLHTDNQSTEDAINSVMPLVLKHLEDSGAYLQMLLIDFSSAFNTLQPHLLIQKLKQLNVSLSIIRCYHSFLTNHSAN